MCSCQPWKKTTLKTFKVMQKINRRGLKNNAITASRLIIICFLLLVYFLIIISCTVDDFKMLKYNVWNDC